MRRRYLVAYDIREPRRLRAVHAAMKGFGEPLQYSVFLCDLDGMEKIVMRQELSKIINHNDDRVAVVDLGESQGRGMDCFEFLGQQGVLPDDGPTIV